MRQDGQGRKARRSMLLALGAITIASVAPACSSASAPQVVGASQAAGEAPGASGDVPVDATVVTGPISFAVEAGSPATGLIGPDGGTLEVSNAAGDHFVLDVPAGALLAARTITMTPVSGFGNTGFDAAGVVLGPSGTFFLAAASLKVTPTTPVPVDRQFAFTFSDDGTQFAAAALHTDTADIVIAVEHFSGYAFGAPLLPSRAAFLEREATDAATRIAGRFDDAVDRDRVATLLGTDADVDLGAEFDVFVRDYEEQVVQPRLAAAGSSCAAATTAIATVLSFDRVRSLFGGASGAGTDVIALITQAFPMCEEEAITTCTAAKDPSILVSFWTGINRQVQLLGGSPIAPLDPAQARAICAPAYAALGDSDAMVVTGTVSDLSLPFTLAGAGPGGSVGSFVFTPTDDREGTFSFSISGGGLELGSGTGTYVIAGDDGGALVLTTSTNTCDAFANCELTTETIDLTPI